MKYIIPVMFLIPLSFCSYAQDTVVSNSVALSSREMPRYPGGDVELRKFLLLNLRYPNDAMVEKIEGEVIVSFLIDTEGNIKNVNAAGTLGHGCEEEAERVVKCMPRWQPAVIRGKNISVLYKLPVVFELGASIGKSGN